MRILILLSAVIAGLTAPAFAQAQRPEVAARFVVSNSIFILYHEIGHLLISELDIPILGREENAADNFATLQLLKTDSELANELLTDVANGWFLSAKDSGSEEIPNEDFYGEHNLDLQRAFQIVCLMVGKDNDVFETAAEQVGMDQERQDSCSDDYDQASTSWDHVLEPFEHEQVGDTDVRIVYDRGVAFSPVRNILQDSHILKGALNSIMNKYSLPSQFSIRAKECGEVNAYYDPWTTEILFCYEIADYFFTIFAQQDLAIKTARNEESSSLELPVKQSKKMGGNDHTNGSGKK